MTQEVDEFIQARGDSGRVTVFDSVIGRRRRPTPDAPAVGELLANQEHRAALDLVEYDRDVFGQNGQHDRLNESDHPQHCRVRRPTGNRHLSQESDGDRG